MLLAALIIIGCVVFMLRFWMKPRRLLLPPVYPGALPIIGHGHLLIGDFQHLWNTEKKIYEYSLQNGEPVEVRLGPHSVYVITDPDDSLMVANNCLEKPYIYNFGKKMYDRGLVTADVWKPHRKLLNSAFNQRQVHTFVEVFITEAKSLVSLLASEIGKGPFDVQPYMLNNFMGNACRTTLGLTDKNHVTVKKYTEATEDLFLLYIERLQRVWLHIPYIFNLSSYKKKQDSLMKVLKDITEEVITNRKSALKLISTSCKTPEPASGWPKQGNLFRWRFMDDSALECKCGAVPQTMGHLISCPACPVSCTLQELMDAGDGAKQVAEFWAESIHIAIDTLRKIEQMQPLLDRMLDLADKQGAFTDGEIREHLDTMIAAAFDTTATTTTFTLILIGSHQDVQERIYRELKEVLGNEDREFNRHDLPKLVYLEAVIKESLRIHPPVPRIARTSSSDVYLKNHILPANGTYVIPLYVLNRHSSWGADAHQFRPERWLDPATLPKNSNTFASFSLGRRNCIGKLYGMLAVKTSLAHILRRYRIKSDIENLVTRCDVLIKPVSGHHISLESRI